MQQSKLVVKHDLEKPSFAKLGIAATVLLFAVSFGSFYSKTPISIVRDGLNLFGPEIRNFTYDQDMPLIFIGGMPRSGTMLMRAILEAHSMVRCGEETHVIPRLLGFREMWYETDVHTQMLLSGGLSQKVMQSAFASFMLEIIVRHAEPAERLCNRDPFLMRYAHYVSELFPNAKFLFIVRDGRATVHSLLSRQNNNKAHKLDEYRYYLTNWNAATEVMLTQCRLAGPNRCLIVYYEQLVMNPRFWLHHVTSFLDLPWQESLMHHETFIGLPGKVSISPEEESSNHINRPLHTGVLSKWVGKFPRGIIEEISTIAPMLRELGYNSKVSLADYSFPVKDSTRGDNMADFRQANVSQQQSWILMASYALNKNVSVAKTVS